MKFWVENKDEFEDTFVKGSEAYKFVWKNLFNGNYRVFNNILDVDYDNYGGSAQFDIIRETEVWFTLNYIGTSK